MRGNKSRRCFDANSWGHHRYSPGFMAVGKSSCWKRKKAKFTAAVWIVILGTVIGAIFGFLFVGVIASIIQLLIWLALVKHFFDCGWLKALVISIIG